MIKIYKTGSFESAHILKGHEKCGKLHGHSYKYEVFIGSRELQPEFGFVIDFGEVKKWFNKYDHSNNVIEISCERLAQMAIHYFERNFPHIEWLKVRIWETTTSYAEMEWFR